jgi:hypothetical protein
MAAVVRIETAGLGEGKMTVVGVDGCGSDRGRDGNEAGHSQCARKGRAD